MTKEFNLNEKRKKLFNIFKNTGMDVESFCHCILEQDKEFIKIVLKEHNEWREDAKVTESFESRLNKRAGKDLI